MKLKKSPAAKYRRMKPEALCAATKAFDEEMIVDQSRELLARSDALARTLGISRAALIEQSLHAVLAARRG